MTFNVAIFIFPDIETLDFCGPLEVFSACNIASGQEHFRVFTFAETLNPLRTINGLQVIPDHTPDDIPGADILVLPGGSGSRKVIENSGLLEKLHLLIERSEFTFSVCSGTRMLAKLGWIDGKDYTTHHSVFDDVQALSPSATPHKGERFTDNGKILTSAGVSAGIDLSFYLLEKLKGRELADITAAYMEYDTQKHKPNQS